MGNVLVREIEEFDLIISEKVDFNIKNIDEYLEIFQEKKREGALQGEFEDNEWIWKFGGVEKTLIFPNDLQFRKLADIFDRSTKEFIIAYKTFVVLKVNNSSLQMFNSKMKAIADDVTSYIEFSLHALLYDLIDFIKLPYKNRDLFKEAIEEAEERHRKRKIDKKARVLPNFIDVFKFSDIINDIVENKDLRNYKRYLMTIAWWKVCSIVPLRASEFVKTPFDCVRIENDKYILSIKRSGIKGRDSEGVVSSVDEEHNYYDDEVIIDEEMYNFIRRFQDLLKSEFGYNDEEKLLTRCLVTQTSKKARLSEVAKKVNEDTIVYRDLWVNLNNFYDEVVNDEYGFIPIEKYIKKDISREYIEKVTLHDARHIAIINLVLLGVDILEVMYLAGHTQVNTTYGYYNHVREITDSYAIAYKYRKEAAVKMSNNTAMVVDRIKERDKQAFQKALSKLNSSCTKLLKVKGGYCSYMNIENDKSICHKLERQHHRCNYFVAESSDVYNKRLEEIDEQIETEVYLLKDMIADMNKISKFNELYQAASYRLDRCISEKILLMTRK